MTTQRHFKIVTLLVFISLSVLASDKQCIDSAGPFFDRELGSQADKVKEVFPTISEEMQQMLVRKIEGMPPQDVSLSIAHPLKNISFFRYQFSKKTRLEAAKAEVFRFLMNEESLRGLLRKAFTPGEGLNTIEKRALIFIIESRYWYDVEWKYFLRFFRSNLKTPFSHYFLSDVMTMRSLFSPKGHKVNEYAKVFEALEGMPGLEEAYKVLDEKIKALEKIRTPSFGQDQKLHNLRIMRASLQLTSADEADIAADLKKVVEDQSLHVVRAILFETFPQMARSGVELSGKVIVWLWGLGILTYITVELIDNIFPEEYEKAQTVPVSDPKEEKETKRGIGPLPADSSLELPNKMLEKTLMDLGTGRSTKE